MTQDVKPTASGGEEFDLPKQYRPIEHEGRVWSKWREAKAFHADPGRVLRGEAEPYGVLIPPPNVTAALHLGHALNNTLQDVLVRAHRMMGYEALWMPGTDHAGIATQAVVEKRLRKEGKLKGALKQAMGREEFVAQVQAYKDEYEGVITGQLQAMGCSCDWDRQRFTMDEVCARAVREAFFRLFRDGLIYRGKRLVNWDPVLQTAVADDECYDEEIEGAFYYLRYPLVHAHGATTERERSRGQAAPADAVPVTWGELAARGYPGAEEREAEQQAWVTVATTRPETYLGDTAVAVNPHDPRAGALRGLSVELPIVGRVVPVIEDAYVVLPERYARDEEERNDPKAKMATGFLKVTPAHDPNDYEIGRRHGLAVVNVMAPDGSISDRHGWEDVGGGHLFVGLRREEARKKVVAEFKARTVAGGEESLFERSTPTRHSVKHSDRSKAIVEPYLSDQWYVKVTDARLAAAANAALEETSSAVGQASPPASPARVQHGGRRDHAATVPGVGPVLQVHERRLPHWQVGGRSYFVTFRLAGGQLTPAERDVVLASCRHGDGEKYELHAAVVMPDHVHLVLTPFERTEGEWISLSEILQGIKSFTAHQLNQGRGTKGAVWQDESYDRIIREGEWEETVGYVMENPCRKGLAARWREYPWCWVPEETLRGRTRFSERWRHQSIRGERVEKRQAGTPAPGGGEGGGEEQRLRFFPARYARTFEQWHEGIRDWCISRQLWWGHRVPVWHKRVRLDGTNRVKELSGRAGLDDILSGERATAAVRVVRVGDGVEVDPTKEPAAGVPGSAGEYDIFVCCVREEEMSGFEAEGYRRDPDVLDTWFSSALWPMSTMGWPDPERANADDPRVGDFPALLKAFNPTTTLCTAREIITLWVSRMTMFNRYFMGEGQGKGPPPFRNVFIHAVIQDGEGRKMSKSLGNGVDPLDIIATHGADAMRFTLCQMATNTQDVRMPVKKDPATGKNTSEKFDLGRNFATKMWNAARFAVAMLKEGEKRQAGTPDPRGVEGGGDLPSRWMLSRLAAGIQEIDGALAHFEFHVYAQTLYDLVWRDFCDWYLEAIKPTVAGDAGQRAVLREVLIALLKLAHPVMPFITEAIWEKVPGAAGLLCRAPWPGAGEAGGDACPTRIQGRSGRDEEAEAEFERVRGVVTGVREIRAQHNVPFKRKVTLHVPKGVELAGVGGLITALAGLERMTAEPASGPSAAFMHDGREYRVSNLSDAVDAGAERARLEKQAGELEKQIGILKGRLANPGYAERAPAAMVQQTKDQLAKAEGELAAVRQRMESA